jgi:glycine dehydrogenase
MGSASLGEDWVMTKNTSPQRVAIQPAKAAPPIDTFARRHLGPRADDVDAMLDQLGYADLDALCDAAVPEAIQLKEPLALDYLPSEPHGEFELLEHLKQMMSANVVNRSCIGMGFSDTIVPPIVQRNILENPGWYTQYTPYQFPNRDFRSHRFAAV